MTETLYSVKWYKDNEEFYRFRPAANPQQQSYKVDGVRVDVSIIISRNYELFSNVCALWQCVIEVLFCSHHTLLCITYHTYYILL